jgi:pimeloyl-ACP methyl ester carboxylesterase
MSIQGDPLERFERSRLAVFGAHGFIGQGRRISDRSGRQTYAIVRDGEAFPAVLVHGGVGSATEWVMMADGLAGPVIIPDRPGNGLTYRIDYRQVDFRSDAARWLLELIDGLDIAEINLVGASMGGFFAIAFAAAHPERVRRLILTGSAAGLFREFPLFLRLWGNPVFGGVISRLKIRDVDMLRKRVYSGLVAQPERIPVDVLDVALAGMALPGTSLTTQTTLHAVTTLRGLRREMWLLDDLAGLQVPTLFVWGDKDRIAPSSIGFDLAERMSNAKVVLMDDAGHIPHIDQPQAVANAINSFAQTSDLR